MDRQIRQPTTSSEQMQRTFKEGDHSDSNGDDDDAILESVLANVIHEEVTKQGGVLPECWQAPVAATSKTNTLASSPQLSSNSGPAVQLTTASANGKFAQLAASMQMLPTQAMADQGDEELLLKELSHLTYTPSPFVLSREQAAIVPSASEVPTESVSVTTPAPPAQESDLMISLQDEQAILDAILVAMDAQQSSVSGDLGGSFLNTGASTKHRAVTRENQLVARVLAEAQLVASSTINVATSVGQSSSQQQQQQSVTTSTSKSQRVLHFHEHVALQGRLREARSVVGKPTCVATAFSLTKVESASSPSSKESPHTAAAAAASESFPSAVVGTSLGVVMLFGKQWKPLGLCGALNTDTVRSHGAVVALSISCHASSSTGMGDAAVIASGHETGTVVLWSARTLAAVRTVTGEFVGPITKLRFLPAIATDPTAHRVLALGNAITGASTVSKAQMLTFTSVMGREVCRVFSVGPAATAGVWISDLDVTPFPTLAYLQDADGCVTRRDTGTVPVIWQAAGAAAAIGSAGSKELAKCVEQGRFLAALVSDDAVLLYSIEATSYSASSSAICNGVARHSYRPLRHPDHLASDLSSGHQGQDAVGPLVAFSLSEQGAPRVTVCVSWGMELELIRVVFSDARGSDTDGIAGCAGDGAIKGMESLAVLRMGMPLRCIQAVAGASLVVLDQRGHIRLVDTTVAAVVEDYAIPNFEPVSFLCTSAKSGTARRNKGGGPSNIQTVMYNGGAMTGDWMSVFVLGTGGKSFTCSLAPWHIRLDALLRKDKYVDAMSLARSFADEVALSTVGMSANASVRRRALALYTERICAAYITAAVQGKKKNGQGQEGHVSKSEGMTGDALWEDTQGSLVEVLTRIITFCARVDSMDVLFGPLMQCMRDLGVDAYVLCAMVMCLEKGLITQLPEYWIDAAVTLFLDPSHLAHMVKNQQWEPNSEVEHLENALMHLEGDLEHILYVAEAHNFWRLRLNTLAHRQRRYATALHCVLDALDAMGSCEKPDEARCSLAAASEIAISAGYAKADVAALALQYVECTLRGASLLPGVSLGPPASESVKAPRALWIALMTKDRVLLVRLLRLDPVGVMDLLVDSLSFVGDSGGEVWRHNSAPNWADAAAALLHVVVGTPMNLLKAGESEDMENSSTGFGDDTKEPYEYRPFDVEQREWPPFSAVTRLLLRLASLVVKHQNALFGDFCDGVTRIHWDNFCIVVVRHVMFLFDAADSVLERTELQETLDAFIRATFDLTTSSVYASFADGFHAKRMSRCSALLKCLQRHYVAAIHCFLDPEGNNADPELARGVFTMLRDEMQRLQSIREQGRETKEGGEKREGYQSSEEAKRSIRELRAAIMEQVAELAQVDTTALAQFVVEFLPSNHGVVMRVLRNSSGTFLKYLDELIEKGDKSVASDMSLQNTYIELLCAHAPERVCAHLKNNDNAITYDVQRALSAVRRFNVVDATMFLLEKTLMLDDAVRVVTDATCKALRALRGAVLKEVCAVHSSYCLEDPDEHSLLAQKTSLPSEDVGAAVAVNRGAESHTSRAEQAPKWLLLNIQGESTGSTLAVAATGTVESPESHVPASPATSLLANPLYTTQLELLMQPLDDLVRIGADFCIRHSKALSPESGFALLNVFVVPRQLLCARQDEATVLEQQRKTLSGQSQLEEVIEEDGTEVNELDYCGSAVTASGQGSSSSAGAEATSSFPPLRAPLTPLGQCFVATMIGTYARYIVSLLRRMIHVLDLAVVVDRIVKEHAHSSLGPYKAIMSETLSVLSFDLEVQKLAEVCAEEDVTALGQSMHRHLNRGVVPLSDFCFLCREHLSTNSTDSASPLTGSSICAFACGHAYHDVCRAAYGAQGCPQCNRGSNTSGRSSARFSKPAMPFHESSASLAVARLRRLKQTRARLGRSGEYYDLLKQFLQPVGKDAPSTSDILAKYTGTKPRVVLAPTPEAPISLTASTGDGYTPNNVVGLTSEDAIVEALTDADIIELFGGTL